MTIKDLVKLIKSNNPEYTVIDLNGQIIGDILNKKISKILEKNTTITSIILRANNLCDESITDTAKLLRINKVINSVNLMFNRLSPRGAKDLAQALKTNASIKSLEIGYNKISNDGVKYLAEALICNTSLQLLGLSYNQVSDSGVHYLTQALNSNNTLLSIDLAENTIGPAGAFKLAKCLRNNSTLKEIRLGFNRIGSSGAKAVAESLHTNQSLILLNIQSNNIGTLGLCYLAEALKNNSTLTSLNLMLNQISSEGIISLAEALKTNTSLTTINLGINPIGISGFSALLAAAPDHYGIQEIIGIPNEIANRLKPFWLRNKEIADNIAFSETLITSLKQIVPTQENIRNTIKKLGSLIDPLLSTLKTMSSQSTENAGATFIKRKLIFLIETCIQQQAKLYQEIDNPDGALESLMQIPSSSTQYATSRFFVFNALYFCQKPSIEAFCIALQACQQETGPLFIHFEHHEDQQIFDLLLINHATGQKRTPVDLPRLNPEERLQLLRKLLNHWEPEDVPNSAKSDYIGLKRQLLDDLPKQSTNPLIFFNNEDVHINNKYCTIKSHSSGVVKHLT